MDLKKSQIRQIRKIRKIRYLTFRNVLKNSDDFQKEVENPDLKKNKNPNN